MNLKPLTDLVTSRMGRQTLLLKKHSPTILFATGVVGVVATVVLASRATLKMEEVLDDVEKDIELANMKLEIESDEYATYTERDRQREVALVYGKCSLRVAKLYLPAAGVGALSIAALTGSHFILSSRNTALMGAYAALDKGFRAYQKRVEEKLGADQEREIRFAAQDHEIVEETEEGAKVKVIRRPGLTDDDKIYRRLFDERNKNWSKVPSLNSMFINSIQNYANDKLRTNGHLFLNEVYDMLGMERSKAGAMVGWVLNSQEGDGYVDFGLFSGKGIAKEKRLEFVMGNERSVWLDFNVDGIIYDLI